MSILNIKPAAWLVLAVFNICGVNAGHYTFPAKSINLDIADDVEFYKQPGLGGAFEDAHPVHGIQIQGGSLDGSYALVGKVLRCETCRDVDGFLVIISPDGDRQWTWTPGSRSNDVLNAVAQMPNGGDLLVVGYQTFNGIAKRTLTRVDPVEKRIVWTTSDFGDSERSHGAWEMIDLSADQSSVLLAGVRNRPNTDEMAFKSYGNVPNGNAVVVELPLSALTTAPKLSDAVWQETWTSNDYVTAKAARSIAGNGVAVLLWGECGTCGATLQLFDSNRQSVWGPVRHGASHGEGTDLAVSLDSKFLAISGHGCATSSCTDDELVGKLTKVNVGTGAMMWSKSYMSCDFRQYSSCSYIKNECWGVQATLDNGFVLACGTGIEDCNGMSDHPGLKEACQREQPIAADPRPGAYARPAAVWQSFIVRASHDGAVVWQRTDQYHNSEVALGNPGWEMQSSASEWVFKCANGDFGFVQDELLGVGLLKLTSSTSSTQSPPVNLTPSPSPRVDTLSPTQSPVRNGSPSSAPSPQAVLPLIPTATPSMLPPAQNCVDGWMDDAGNGCGDLNQEWCLNYGEEAFEQSNGDMVSGKAACRVCGCDDDPIPSPKPGAPVLRDVANCEGEYRYVSSKNACAAAAKKLKASGLITDATPSRVDKDNRPKGCYYKAGNRKKWRRLFFNEGGDEGFEDARLKRQSICISLGQE